MLDKRTGQEFPSVARENYRRQHRQLADDSTAIRTAIHELDVADRRMRQDQSNDWVLTLDVDSLAQYGAFADTYIIYGEEFKTDPADQVRPIEWFHRVGQLVKQELFQSSELWDVMNAIFDKAAAATDGEMSFARPAAVTPQPTEA